MRRSPHPGRRTYTRDGQELTFQVNYLAPYLLTTKLVPRLASAGGRVINVSSDMHRGGNINWNNLARERQYWPLAAYAQSKLALTMYTKSLAEAGGASFTAVSVHPGVFRTRLLFIYDRVGRPAEEAAPILTTLASPTHPVVDGGYYDGLRLARPRRWSRTRALAAGWRNSALTSSSRRSAERSDSMSKRADKKRARRNKNANHGKRPSSGKRRA